MLIPYVTATIRRDTMNIGSAKVMAHEILILEAIHGEESVTIVPTDGTLGGRRDRDITSPRAEWDRLERRYGINPETNMAFIVQAYGTPQQFAQALEECTHWQVEYVDGPDYGGADNVEVEPELSDEEVQKALEDERKAGGFEPVENAELDALKAERDQLADQNAQMMERLAALEAKMGAGEPGTAEENKPVTKMTIAEMRAELELRAVEFDEGANTNQLRALLSEVRNSAVQDAAAE